MNPLSNRYLSLDVFRGLDVTLMIMVNSLGSPNTYSSLLHANWHGFTLTDLVFPTFLFVVGSSMSFSMAKYAVMGHGAVLKKIFTRAAIIFLLGYLSYWFPFVRVDAAGEWFIKPMDETRIFGVLQRIALCYMLAALIIHYVGIRGALYFSVVALIGYWMILNLFGDLTLAGNAARKLDIWLIGEKHMHRGDGMAFDPEGLLGTLPATVNVIMGYAAALYLRRGGKTNETLRNLLLVGVSLVVVAVLWNAAFPINKKLWTSSFVLFTVGIDLAILAALVFVVDIAGQTRWTYFFETFGRNTLFIYLFSEIFVVLLRTFSAGDVSLHSWIFQNLFISWASEHNGAVLFAVWVMLSCWMVGYLMDRKKIYIKV
jgi:predicted acyltransferase